MKYFFLFFSVFLFQNSLSAQKYYTRTGHVHVHSVNNIMELDADNYQMNSTFDATTGEVMFVGLIKSFEFDLGLADRLLHNERISIVDQPKILFEGEIVGLKGKDLSVPGRHLVTVQGNLYIYGYKRVTSAQGFVRVAEDGSMKAESDFSIKIEKESVDQINKLMRDHLPNMLNIDANQLGLSRDIDITVKFTYRPRA